MQAERRWRQSLASTGRCGVGEGGRPVEWAESKECGVKSQPRHSPPRNAPGGSERRCVRLSTGILFNVKDVVKIR